MKLTFWDAVNPFAGEYIFDEPQQRLEFIITRRGEIPPSAAARTG